MKFGVENPFIRATLLDWDDNVVSTFDSCVDLYTDFAATHGLPAPTAESMRKLWGRTLNDILHTLWQDADHVTLVPNFMGYVHDSDFCIRPFPDSVDTLLTLKNMQLQLGVISTGRRAPYDRTRAQHVQLPHGFFFHEQCLEDYHAHKPDPQSFRPALEKLSGMGIGVEQTLYVGDGLNDLFAAQGNEMTFVGVTTGVTTAEEFYDNGLPRDQVIASFSLLPQYIRNRYTHAFK